MVIGATLAFAQRARSGRWINRLSAEAFGFCGHDSGNAAQHAAAPDGGPRARWGLADSMWAAAG